MAAQMACRLLLSSEAADKLTASTAPFKNVAANDPYAGYIAYCAQNGIMAGYADGTFQSGNSLSGYAVLKILLGTLGYDATAEGFVGSNWAINVAIKASQLGLTDGLNKNFHGGDVVTQEEACLYALNTLRAPRA